jgi:hypothetical protein
MTTHLRLEICKKCGTHGHIVYKDGQQSMEIFSKRQGAMGIQTDLMDGLISHSDWERLFDQIKQSTIPDSQSLTIDMLLTLAYEAAGEQANAFLHEQAPTENTSYRFKIEEDKAGVACGFFYGPCGYAYPEPFYSKRKALKALGMAAQVGVIDDGGKARIKLEIISSGLPDCD